MSIEYFLIKDCVLGSFHQGGKRFGETVGNLERFQYGKHLILIIYWKVETEFRKT